MRVARWGTREGKPFHEQVGWISDLAFSADDFRRHRQQHGGIEKRLHWVRDVTFEEDSARPGGHAPVIWVIWHWLLSTIVPQLGLRTMPQGVRALTKQVEQIYQFLTHAFASA